MYLSSFEICLSYTNNLRRPLIRIRISQNLHASRLNVIYTLKVRGPIFQNLVLYFIWRIITPKIVNLKFQLNWSNRLDVASNFVYCNCLYDYYINFIMVTISRYFFVNIFQMHYFSILANFQISERGTNEGKKFKKRNIPKFPIHYYTKIAAKTGTHDKIILFFASKRGTVGKYAFQLRNFTCVVRKIWAFLHTKISKSWGKSWKDRTGLL